MAVNSAGEVRIDALSAPAGADSRSPGQVGRAVPMHVPGLEGIRGLAALYVVLHHCYLVNYPGFPVNTGPAWGEFFMYGHFAVGVFIVLSGFSLGLKPARNGWQIGGLRDFAARRAWRILPPYWAALAFSLVIAWSVTVQPGEASPNIRSVLTYGLLVQDVIGAPSPNGAMWSIAVEAQLYLLFPALVWVLWRLGWGALLGVVFVVVSAIGISAPRSEVVDMLTRLSPQFAALFTLGIIAAGIMQASERVRSLPWLLLAALALIPPLFLVLLQDSVWTHDHVYWFDLALGPGIAFLLVALAVGRTRVLPRMLDSRPIYALGVMSYSLYLTHAPIVVALHHLLSATTGTESQFLLTVVVVLPATLVFAWCFARLFEIPFTRRRAWSGLWQFGRARTTQLWRSAAR